MCVSYAIAAKSGAIPALRQQQQRRESLRGKKDLAVCWLPVHSFFLRFSARASVNSRLSGARQKTPATAKTVGDDCDFGVSLSLSLYFQ